MDMHCQGSLKISMEVSVDTLLSDRDLEGLREQGLRFLAIPPEFYDLDEAVVRQRYQRLMALDFCIDTCHPPYGGGNRPHSMCSELDDIRLSSIAMWKHYLQKFSLTGMRAVPLHTGGGMHPAGSKKALERLTDSIGQILPEAKKSNVIIALENTFFQNPCPFSDAPNPSGVQERFINDDCQMLADYVTAWHDPLIRVCHDIGHSNIFGHQVQTDMDILSPLTALYHVHDNDGMNDCHWNVGEGRLPWDIVVNKLVKNGYAFPLYDEVLGEADPELKPLLKQPRRVSFHYQEAQKTLEAYEQKINVTPRE